jgi:hypothetical protein
MKTRIALDHVEQREVSQPHSGVPPVAGFIGG